MDALTLKSISWFWKYFRSFLYIKKKKNNNNNSN